MIAFRLLLGLLVVVLASSALRVGHRMRRYPPDSRAYRDDRNLTWALLGYALLLLAGGRFGGLW